MSETPLVSILVANYNNGQYLQEAVNSILAQTYPNWEIVIVDDCSTDSSHDLYPQLSADSRIHIFYNERNFGAGYTKRRCVEESRGEICGFVDPDDLLAEPDVIKQMVDAHLDHPAVSLVYSGCYETDENLNVIREVPGRDFTQKSALETCSWPIRHFVTFKKKCYDETVGIDPFMKRAVDYDMYYKLEEVGEILHLDRILYIYRHNRNSISLNDNEYKSRAWHTYTCVEAMKRRGLTDEKMMLFPIEDALRREYRKGAEHMKTTNTYKVGETILHPIRWIRRLFGKA